MARIWNFQSDWIETLKSIWEMKFDIFLWWMNSK